MNNRQALSLEKRFLSHKRGSNSQPANGKLRYKFDKYVRSKRKLLYITNDIDEIYMLEV